VNELRPFVRSVPLLFEEDTRALFHFLLVLSLYFREFTFPPFLSLCRELVVSCFAASIDKVQIITFCWTGNFLLPVLCFPPSSLKGSRENQLFNDLARRFPQHIVRGPSLNVSVEVEMIARFPATTLTRVF